MGNVREFVKNYTLIWQTQQGLRSERYNAFTEEINKISLRPNDDKRIQSIDLMEIYTYERTKNLVSEKKGIKCNNLTKQ